MHKWTEEQYQYLADNVKGTPYKELTERFNAKYGASLKVSTLGAALGRRNLTNGISANFSKGHQPHNKGIKGWQAGGNSRNTQFKKGRVSENYKPVGSERVDSKDGYTYIKVADPKTWELKHRHIWLQSGRKIPEGHTVLFADGDRTNITLDNLMLVSREQLAVLNKGGLLQKDKSLNEVAINIANLTMKVTESKKRKPV